MTAQGNHSGIRKQNGHLLLEILQRGEQLARKKRQELTANGAPVAGRRSMGTREREKIADDRCNKRIEVALYESNTNSSPCDTGAGKRDVESDKSG